MDLETLELRPITLLIIDDYRPDIKLAQKVLEEGKLLLNIKTAENGEMALAYLRKENNYRDVETPDLILLDLRMPLMDGHKLLQIIKTDDNLKRIPVIIMTISKDEEDIEMSYNEHANAYIIKPIAYDQFVDAIRSLENFWLTVVRLPTKI